jgi:uncharacterized membrane protein
MRFREAIRNSFRQGVKGFTGGCLTHLLITIFALVLIVVFAHYTGLSDGAAFASSAIAVVLIFIMAAWKKEERP